MPKALLSFDAAYLLGFCWVPARRGDASITFDDYAATIHYGDLIEAFWTALTGLAKEAADAAPLAPPNRAERRRTTPHKKTASRSAGTSAGRSATSKPSPSKKSPTAPSS
jgi:hypothetical protein